MHFQATPTYPPTHPEVFAVVLSLESLSPLEARVREDAAVAMVEPRGVVRLAYPSYSGVEGDVVRAERERDRERKTERQRETERESQRERERVCVFVCVYVW